HGRDLAVVGFHRCVPWVGGESRDRARRAHGDRRLVVLVSYAPRFRVARHGPAARGGGVRRRRRARRVVARDGALRCTRRPRRIEFCARIQALLRGGLRVGRRISWHRGRDRGTQPSDWCGACGARVRDALARRPGGERRGAEADCRRVAGRRDHRRRGVGARGAAYVACREARVILFAFLAQTLRIAIPYLFAASGGVISERAGLIGLGLEGYMLGGAFCGAIAGYYSGNPWIGLIGALAGGAALALLYAVTAIRFRADQ